MQGSVAEMKRRTHLTSVNTEWIALRARVEEITGQVQQAEKKAIQAEADRDEKRRPYEADPLFMYLWRRKFGTAAYRANPFTRYMDRMVAGVVGYESTMPCSTKSPCGYASTPSELLKGCARNDPI